MTYITLASSNTKTLKIMKASINISDFSFEFKGHGHYKVTYQSPVTLKKWSKTITDMTIIDATKNEDQPKKVDLTHLKNIIKA